MWNRCVPRDIFLNLLYTLVPRTKAVNNHVLCSTRNRPAIYPKLAYTMKSRGVIFSFQILIMRMDVLEFLFTRLGIRINETQEVPYLQRLHKQLFVVCVVMHSAILLLQQIAMSVILSAIISNMYHRNVSRNSNCKSFLWTHIIIYIYYTSHKQYAVNHCSDYIIFVLLKST